MNDTSNAVTHIKLRSLPLVANGKVRELYKVDPTTLLMAVTDRISAYDVVLKTGIPDKGPILCQISAYWFKTLESKLPALRHHLRSLNPPLPPLITSAERSSLHGRCMQVKATKVFQIEAIVRGYLTGSAWAEYKKGGTVHGMPQPKGLRHCEKFPKPMYTPSTKAPAGESDVNISSEQAREIVGREYADRIETLALELYSAAHDHAEERGILIADTKFEFGLDEETDEIVLVDEALTPDSSRFWSAPVQVGQEQPSFDKQYVRDWLTENGKKKIPDVELPHEVVDKTRQLYRDIFERLTGQSIDQAISQLPSH